MCLCLVDAERAKSGFFFVFGWLVENERGTCEPLEGGWPARIFFFSAGILAEHGATAWPRPPMCLCMLWAVVRKTATASSFSYQIFMVVLRRALCAFSSSGDGAEKMVLVLNKNPTDGGYEAVEWNVYYMKLKRTVCINNNNYVVLIIKLKRIFYNLSRAANVFRLHCISSAHISIFDE